MVSGFKSTEKFARANIDVRKDRHQSQQLQLQCTLARLCTMEGVTFTLDCLGKRKVNVSLVESDESTTETAVIRVETTKVCWCPLFGLGANRIDIPIEDVLSVRPWSSGKKYRSSRRSLRNGDESSENEQSRITAEKSDQV